WRAGSGIRSHSLTARAASRTSSFGRVVLRRPMARQSKAESKTNNTTQTGPSTMTTKSNNFLAAKNESSYSTLSIACWVSMRGLVRGLRFMALLLSANSGEALGCSCGRKRRKGSWISRREQWVSDQRAFAHFQLTPPETKLGKRRLSGLQKQVWRRQLVPLGFSMSTRKWVPGDTSSSPKPERLIVGMKSPWRLKIVSGMGALRGNLAGASGHQDIRG